MRGRVGVSEQLFDLVFDLARRAVRERETRTRSGRLVKFDFDESDRSQVGGIIRLAGKAQTFLEYGTLAVCVALSVAGLG